MSFAYQIPGWLEGKKIRRKAWNQASFIYLNDRQWCGVGNNTRELFSCDDWEPYEEPRKKRKVTLYRPIYKSPHGISTGHWTEWKDEINDVIGHETREIEVDCDQ